MGNDPGNSIISNSNSIAFEGFHIMHIKGFFWIAVLVLRIKTLKENLQLKRLKFIFQKKVQTE